MRTASPTRSSRGRLAAAAALGLTLALAGPGVAGAEPPGEHRARFAYDPTLDAQRFTVPDDVCSIDVEVRGASGGSTRHAGVDEPLAGGGLGGVVSATLAVAPGDVLLVVPGSRGEDRVSVRTAASPTYVSEPGGTGGANGGGAGGEAGHRSPDESIYLAAGAGGGGASDIRTSTDPADRLVVAGGGGGAGGYVLAGMPLAYYQGGAGGQAPTAGGTTGAPASPGQGGVVGAAGAAGGTGGLVPAGDGTATHGGTGAGSGDLGFPAPWVYPSGAGGGGGGYGGGGGGESQSGVSGGGGGGASWTRPSPEVGGVAFADGTAEGDGSVEIGWDVRPGCAEDVPLANPRPLVLIVGLAGVVALAGRRFARPRPARVRLRG